MQFHEEPKKKGRGLTILSASLVVILLGCMVAMVLFPGNGGEGEAAGAPGASASPSPSNGAVENTPAIATPSSGGASIDLRSNPFVEIARDASPSVVGVSNKIRWFVDQSGSLGDVEQGSGSGVIISKDGYIVTNQHVISGAEIVTVVMVDGEEIEAKVVGEDKTSDLAVLKIEKEGLVPAKIGNSASVQVGEFAIAIGSPLGNQLFGSVTLGIISATGRILDLSDDNRVELLQTDAAINPGNSGGALYNVRGELIGINTIKFAYAGSGISAEGLGFAIPIDNALPIVNELIQNGKVVRPVLGIGLVMVDEYTAKQANVPIGVLVRKVYEGSPAAKAGLREMDIITHIDGTKIEIYADLTSKLNSHQFGDEVQLTIYRDGKTLDVTAVLAAYEIPPQ